MKKRASATDRLPTATRLPVVGVMGSGVRAHELLAAPLGRGLARMGVHLLTGGGGGVMSAVSQAFAGVEDRIGLVVGVLPGSGAGGRAGAEAEGLPPPGYPNPWVELAVRTHLAARGDAGGSPASRNHVNVLSSDVVVALPGGEGTASEVALALRYGRPLVVLGELGRVPDGADVCTTNDVTRALSIVRRLLRSEPTDGSEGGAAGQLAASGPASSSSHD